MLKMLTYPALSSNLWPPKAFGVTPDRVAFVLPGSSIPATAHHSQFFPARFSFRAPRLAFDRRHHASVAGHERSIAATRARADAQKCKPDVRRATAWSTSHR